MVQKFRAVVLIIIGIVAVGLSIKCFSFDALQYESTSRYGGDAFTGIQNAAAVTSKNVKELAEIVQFGFGAILLVIGIGLIGFGLTTPIGNNVEVKYMNMPMERKEEAKDTLPTTENKSNEEIRKESSEE
jgi:hypothetical protein